MASTRQTRRAALCACAALGLVASMLVRRAGTRSGGADPEREAFIEARRERMRAARGALFGSSDRSA